MFHYESAKPNAKNVFKNLKEMSQILKNILKIEIAFLNIF